MTAASANSLFASLDTPALLVDDDIVDRNIQAMADTAASLQVALRPHIKTHKLPSLAKRQQAAGARGITVARLEEAEAMVAAGIRDVFLAYPIVSESGAQRAQRLAAEATLCVAVEEVESAQWLDRHLDGADVVEAMIEIDTGHGRCGLSSPQAALDLARAIDGLGSLRLRGIFTHEGHAYGESTATATASVGHRAGALMGEIAQLIRAADIELRSVSVGCSLTVESAGAEPDVTEARPGTYVFNDRSQLLHGRASIDDCAAHVLTTVVSAPAADRVVVDAGSKALALDHTLTNPPIGDYGHVVGAAGWSVARLTEEHGVLRAADDAEALRPGDRLRIVPNHICPVVNLFDQVVVHRSGELVGLWSTTGRSRQQWQRA